MKRCTMGTHRSPLNTLCRVAWACAAAAIFGCEQELDVEAYTAPADTAVAKPAAMPTASTPSMPTQPQAPRELAWQLPEGWREQPSDSAFRVTTLLAGEGEAAMEVVVTRVPGQRGGITENVNRWRGQVGLEPLPSEQVIPLVQPVKSTRAFGMWTDLQGAEQRTVVAWFELPEASWYFKATAPPAVVDAHLEAFTALIESVGSASPPPPSGHVHTADDGHDHAEHATADGALTPFRTDTVAGVLPAGWSLRDEPGNMRLAAFDVKSASGVGLASIARFPGDVGGLLANLNRWRNQLGLSPIDNADEQPFISHPETNPIMRLYHFVSPDGGSQDKAMLVLLVPDAESTWFIRLDGTRASVGEQLPGLRDFIDHLQLPLAIPPQVQSEDESQPNNPPSNGQQEGLSGE